MIRYRKYLATARNEVRMVFIYRGSLLALMAGAVVLIVLQYFVWRRAG